MKAVLSLAIVVVVAAGCGRTTVDYIKTITSDASDVDVPVPTYVTAAFPAHAHWNAYIQGGSGPVWGLPDVDCDPTSLTCVQAGTVLRYDATGEDACLGLIAKDTLDAFVWQCDDSSGHAVFYSVAMRSAARLADLLDGSAFAANALSVSRDGSVVVQSTSTSWWRSPVMPLPPDEPTGTISTTLDTPYAIYVATQPTTRGYRIAADGIALVVPRGATLTLGPGAGSMCTTVANVPPGSRCIVQIDAKNFAWIEGAFNAVDNLGMHITANGAAFASIRNAEMQYGRYGVIVTGSHSLAFTHMRAAQLIRYGVIFESSDHIRFVDLTMSAIGVDNAAASFLIHGNTSDVTIVGAVIEASRPYAVFLNPILGDTYTGRNVTMALNTIVNGDSAGIVARNAPGLTVVQSIVANHLNNALSYDTTSSGSFGSLAVTTHATGIVATTPISETSPTPIYGGGNTTADCSEVDTSGTVVGSCDFATVNTGFDETNGLVGATNSTTDFASLTDWIEDSPFRTWNADAAFPDVTLRSGCLSGTCRLFDWRVHSGGVAFQSASANGRSDAFVAGFACPNITAMTDGQGNIFLIDAMEMIDDGVGDDDGLCEANEACIYAPHIGAYQGEGALTEACVYSGADVRGVTLYAYSQALAD